MTNLAAILVNSAAARRNQVAVRHDDTPTASTPPGCASQSRAFVMVLRCGRRTITLEP
ncbi:hypothetical protein [Streptomyces sp. NPDC097981]|uniref:hypothetical protein n=1 Tax=Streptomyces sp. NPDC097981 TaxID=3155428 RepID=UPI00331A1B71